MIPGRVVGAFYNSRMLKRRALMVLPAAAWASAVPGGAAAERRRGKLVVIGGAEDKRHDRVILRRFVELAGGPGAKIRVLSAASGDPDGAWATYDAVFDALGVSDRAPIPVPDRVAADSAAVTDLILEADGIFISGGDQNRLMDLIWETAAFRALHVAYHLRGACVGGTSAGAAVMSRHMIAQGSATRLPVKGAAGFDLGLGFLHRAMIDQHFAERGRLARLMSALAQRPQQLGVGIDEDTALIVERGTAIEVIGAGAVTLLDGRELVSDFELVESAQGLQMLGVRLHWLPAGHRYSANPLVQRAQAMPVALREAIDMLVTPGPIRG